MEMTPTANGGLALVAALAGGLATKFVDKIFASRERRLRDDADKRKELSQEEVNFRAELRQQVKDLKEDMRAKDEVFRTELKETRNQLTSLMQEVDEWRNKYYQNVAANLDLNNRHNILVAEHNELKADYAELSREYHELRKQLQWMHDQLKKRGISLDPPPSTPSDPPSQPAPPDEFGGTE